ncbi:unnamed protein product [Linum trigynum]|uniref:Uncharacterized protein n=1 Tax=Linum trigynum TaxID=586398 RepID=A0AAV2GMG6_9ROSI
MASTRPAPSTLSRSAALAIWPEGTDNCLFELGKNFELGLSTRGPPPTSSSIAARSLDGQETCPPPPHGSLAPLFPLASDTEPLSLPRRELHHPPSICLPISSDQSPLLHSFPLPVPGEPPDQAPRHRSPYSFLPISNCAGG